MNENIDNFIALVLGKRKTGKTKYIIGDEELNIPSLVDIYFNKGMKVCIIDEMYHPDYSEIPVLPKEKIKYLDVQKPVVFRCIGETKSELREIQYLIAQYFWNGLIIFEDAFRYEKKVISEPLAKIIGNSKQKNVDVMIMYHHWKFVPLDLYIYLDIIELFKTKSAPSERELEELIGYEDEVIEAYNKVSKHPSQFYHQTVYVTQ